MRKKDSQEKNIQVVVRCRPRSSQEIKDYSPSVIECLPNKKEVSVRHDIADKSSVTKTFGFDRVFNPSSSQLEVYRYVVCPLLEEVLLGYNCTVFAYGQTGTGKTFTMEGEKSLDGGSWDKEPKAGIVPRAMQQLFEQLEAMPDCEFSVRVSFMEIYNEDLFDLLGSSLDSQKLRIFEDSAKKGSVFVQGIEETIVRDKNEVYEILERGRAKRQTAATLMNAQSSRSHSLFSVTVHIKESSVSGEEMLKTGKLNLVDLAGSENVGRSGAVDKRLREAGTINQSLLTLGRVITALVERAPHIPYRESKLTRLLQDSLGGRTKTTIIATISPASCNVEETLSTLDYAHRAKNILNRPEINQKLTKKTLIKEYTEEIDKLKKDLLAAREKNGIYLAIENYNDMQSKLKSREESLRSTHEKLSHLESEFATVSRLFRDTSEELSGTKNELQDTRGVLHQTRCNLKKTIEDRDGLDFVLKEYDQTEARLFARSSELLEMVNNISGDIHKLHNTLERKTHVEKTNSKHKKAYHSQFSKCIDDLQQTVFDYCKEEKSRTQERLTWLRNQVTEKNKLLSRQKEFVDDLFARRQQFVLDILDTEKRHLSSEEDWKEAVSEAVTAKKDKVIELLQLVCSNQWNDAIDCVKRSFEDTQSNLSDIQKFMAEQSAKREELVSEYLEQKRIAVEMIEGRLDKFMNEQAKQIKEISCTHRKKKDEILQCTSNMRKLIEQLTSTVDMQSGLLESKWTQEEEERCQLQLANVNFVEDSKRTLTDFPKQDAAFASVVSSHFDTTQKKIDDTVHEVFQDIEESAELHKHVEETGLYVKNNGVCIAEDWQKCINESLTDRMACSSRHFNIQQKQVEEYAKTSLSDYATLGENITYDEQQFDNMIQTSEELTHILVESLDSLKSKHSAQTDHIDEKMSTFISVDLVEDVSTGMTPIRQQYKYPTHLPRTEDRRTLWQMFKENYDVPTTPQLNVRARKLEDTAEGIDFEAEDIFMDNEGSDVDIRATENAANLEMHSQRCDDDVDNEEKENISQDVEEEKMRKKFDDGNKNQRSLSSLGVNNSTSEGVVRNKTTRLKNSSKSQ